MNIHYRKNEFFHSTTFITDDLGNLNRQILTQLRYITNSPTHSPDTFVDIIETHIQSNSNLTKHIIVIQFALCSEKDN